MFRIDRSISLAYWSCQSIVCYPKTALVILITTVAAGILSGSIWVAVGVCAFELVCLVRTRAGQQKVHRSPLHHHENPIERLRSRTSVGSEVSTQLMTVQDNPLLIQHRSIGQNHEAESSDKRAVQDENHLPLREDIQSTSPVLAPSTPAEPLLRSTPTPSTEMIRVPPRPRSTSTKRIPVFADIMRSLSDIASVEASNLSENILKTLPNTIWEGFFNAAVKKKKLAVGQKESKKKSNSLLRTSFSDRLQKENPSTRGALPRCPTAPPPQFYMRSISDVALVHSPSSIRDYESRDLNTCRYRLYEDCLVRNCVEDLIREEERKQREAEYEAKIKRSEAEIKRHEAVRAETEARINQIQDRLEKIQIKHEEQMRQIQVKVETQVKAEFKAMKDQHEADKVKRDADYIRKTARAKAEIIRKVQQGSGTEQNRPRIMMRRHTGNCGAQPHSNVFNYTALKQQMKDPEPPSKSRQLEEKLAQLKRIRGQLSNPTLMSQYDVKITAVEKQIAALESPSND